MKKNCVSEIIELEKNFASNNYNGSGESNFIIKKGNIPIIISAPHAVNHFRNGKMKCADVYTGGIATYLQKITNCHLICSTKFSFTDPNYDVIEQNAYQRELKKYLENNNIFLLIDLHGASQAREFGLELGTAPENGKDDAMNKDPSLKGFSIIAKYIENVFKEEFQTIDLGKIEIWRNRIFDAGGQNTVTKYVSKNTNVACVQLEINAIYRNPQQEEGIKVLVSGLERVILYFSQYNWECDIR